jgi:serine/threonine protein kinase
MGLDLPEHLAARYRVLDQLGEGGAGQVFAAWDMTLQTQCAVKVVRLDPGRDETERARYRESTLREARALARLTHESIVRIFDLQEAGERVFLFLEYVGGCSLEDLL